MRSESKIQKEIRLAIGQLPDVVVWRNNVGSAVFQHGRVAYGLCRGSSDIIGILKPSGRFLAFEVKTVRGVASEEQRLFLELVRSMGGFAAIVRSRDDATKAVERARAGHFE